MSAYICLTKKLFCCWSHLFLCPFSLHGDGVVRPVVRLRAEHAHTGLIPLTEQLQEPFVLRTHPVLHVGNGLYQLVLGEPGGMRRQVLLAVGSETHEAGFDRFWPAVPQADITEDFLPGRRREGRGGRREGRGGRRRGGLRRWRSRDLRGRWG